MNKIKWLFGAIMVFALVSTVYGEPVRGKKDFRDDVSFNKDVEFKDRVYREPIIVDNIAQFKAWSINDLDLLDYSPEVSGVTQISGTSLYYLLKPDRTHIVDLYAIQESANTWLSGAPGGATTIQTFAGVTLVMFDASKNPYSTAEVEVAVTGATGYDRMKSGASVVEIWPNPGTDLLTAVTNYETGAHAAQRQTLTLVSSASPYGYNPTTGIPYDASNSRISPISVLKRPGDRIKLRAMNSSVSAYVIDLRVTASDLGASD